MGHTRSQLDQFMVEQRHPAFERDRHAHSVGQQQEIVGKLRLRVDGKHAVDVVAARSGSERIGKCVAGALRALAQQRGCGIDRKHFDVRTITLFERQSGRRQEAFGQTHRVEQRRVAIAGKALAERERRPFQTTR